ncbi:MAG TPA: hypothetical protein VHC50_00065 [Puia sp.]|nr:hypothetical protein [Puia sp.]
MLSRTTILSLLMMASLYGLGYSKKIPKSDSGTVVISLQNAADRQSRIDSIYLIFDRYDLRGAGIVKQVYRPTDNQVRLIIPKGKYYVSIFCLGIYNKAGFDRVITVKANRTRKILLRLQASALFTPGMVEIPKQKWDPSHLAILRPVNSR